MADSVDPKGTPPTPPAETPPAPAPDAPKGDQPAPTDGATPPTKGKDGATPGDDDSPVTLSRKDYNKIISQRDTANGQAAFVNQLAQERYITEFLKTNADKYPDLEPADLAHIWGEDDDFHAEAKRLQDRLTTHAQKKLHDIEHPPAPPHESPEDRATREEELAKNPGKDSLAKAIAGRM